MPIPRTQKGYVGDLNMSLGVSGVYFSGALACQLVPITGMFERAASRQKAVHELGKIPAEIPCDVFGHRGKR